MQFDKSAKDKQWGFTEVSRPRFITGSDTAVLVCHGFGGAPCNMRCLTEAAEELGLTVAVPLLSGHASTLGDMQRYCYKDWQADVDRAYDLLIENGCKKVFLCGLSMGALLMADLAERHSDDSRISGAVLICPPVKMRGYLTFSAKTLLRAAPYVLTSDGFRPDPDAQMYYGMATEKLNDIITLGNIVRKNASALKAPVTLVRAGRDNRVAPRSYRILRKKLAETDYICFDNAPHGIPYSDSRDELKEFFKDYLQANALA